jgi:hypothetical protein
MRDLRRPRYHSVPGSAPSLQARPRHTTLNRQGSAPAPEKIRPEWPGGLIPGNRKISRAPQCNRWRFFRPYSGCSKKCPGPNAIKIKIFPAGFCREDFRERCHPFPDCGCSEPTIAGARTSGRGSRSSHCGVSELLLPSRPSLLYKGVWMGQTVSSLRSFSDGEIP